ncbi:hypothetical protein [Haliangium ochraceum]|uniref:Tetratricopeptide repeat protein n=1 Tax=Haliangium ochraceum (strain DSM 14365 / JCM 11303 / SMP-2) TaxID=502025 RepID=D0LJF7_HALO1|nr:hypothetical protein [Haliangium ochraceum]ACY16531.1 hypothetical protein Hoch_4032 [Haliangium ochraceum DSM 14365]
MLRALLHSGLLLLVFLALPAAALAQDRTDQPAAAQQIERLHREAMARYDGFEFEEAKARMDRAVALAAEHGLTDAPVMVRVFIDLAVIYGSGLGDTDGARRALRRAVSIDPEAELDPAYKSPELDELLAEIKREYARSAAAESPAERAGEDDDGGCADLTGLEHAASASASAGEAVILDARVSPWLEAATVRVHYGIRGATGGGAGGFEELRMTASGTCGYRTVIPGDAVRAPGLVYYLAAYDQGGERLAGKGNADAPLMLAVTAAGGRDAGEGGGARLFVRFGAGTAAGYLSGRTEQAESEIQCCVAPELLHLQGELGYFLSPALSVSAAFRMGFPLGANLPGHAVGAPALLLRARHSSEPALRGLLLSLVAGAGYARHTVGLANATPGQDVDTGALGPLLLGAGVGYALELSDSLRLAAELDTLVGIPVAAEFAGADTVFGVHLGLDIGLVAAF